MFKRLWIPFVLVLAFACLLLPGQAFAQPALSITKSHTGNFTVGTNGTYTIKVKNVGTASTSATITVTDTLPAGLTFIVGTGAGWTCSASAQTVTCTNPGPIANGSSSTIALIVSVGTTAVPSVSNTASVSGGGAATGASSTPDATMVNKTVKSGPAVYISTFAGQQILVVDGAVGTTAAVKSSTGFAAEDIVVGPDARIYICNPDAGIVQRVKQDGNELETIYNASTSSASPKPGAPEGPSFKGNHLFFNAKNGDGAWEIAGVATIGFGGPFPAPSRVTPTGITLGEGTAFGSDGNLLIVDRTGNQVLKFDFSSTTLSTFIQNPESCSGELPSGCVLDKPIGIAVRNSDGHIFVANAGSRLQNINHFDSGGVFKETYASFSGTDFPFFLEFDALDRVYVVTNDLSGAGGKVWRIDPLGGETNLVFLVALSTVENTNGVGSTDQAVGLGLGLNASVKQSYTASSSPIQKRFNFTTTEYVNITFTAVSSPGFILTVFREEIPEALLGLQLPTSGPNLHFPCAEYDSDHGTCVVYEEGVGPRLDPLTAGFTGPVDYQLFYTPSGSTGVPVLAHAEDDMLQSPVDQYDENELTGFTLATSVGDPTGMDGGSGGISRHVALNTPQTQTGTTLCGFQSPVPGQTFSTPQAVPVRFKIAVSGGNCQMGPYVTNAVSQLWLFNTSTQKFVTPTSKSNTGNFFFANTTTGQNNYNIDTKNLAPGTYIFTMTSNSVSAAFSFFILTQ